MTRSMTLDALPLDVPAVLVSLGVDPEHLSMLRGMGIVEGREVRVLRRAAFGGPLQVFVGEVTLALDRAVAQKLRVEPSAPVAAGRSDEERP
jgi:Fe2+ transport system protein FeoA